MIPDSSELSIVSCLSQGRDVPPSKLISFTIISNLHLYIKMEEKQISNLYVPLAYNYQGFLTQILRNTWN